MASSDEIMNALLDFQRQCRGKKRLREMLEDCSKVLHYAASDTGDAFTMVIGSGQITEIKPGKEGSPDIVIETDSETLCDMFWGDINPSQKYERGEIKIEASQEDIERLNEIRAVIWPEISGDLLLADPG